MRFSPLQTDYAVALCQQNDMQADLSTGILIEVDEEERQRAYRDSAAILRILPHLGFPYNLIGFIGLAVPKIIRDTAYRGFARNRGFIWKKIKYVTGMGDTKLSKYRDRILGLPEEPPLDPGWGFDDDASTALDNKQKKD